MTEKSDFTEVLLDLTREKETTLPLKLQFAIALAKLRHMADDCKGLEREVVILNNGIRSGHLDLSGIENHLTSMEMIIDRLEYLRNKIDGTHFGYVRYFSNTDGMESWVEKAGKYVDTVYECVAFCTILLQAGQNSRDLEKNRKKSEDDSKV